MLSGKRSPFCPGGRWVNSWIRVSVHHFTSRDDVIKWKHFPHYWPFVQGIQRSSVNSPHKGQWRGALIFYPRPVLAFGYCRCLRLSVCVSVCVCVRQPQACPRHKSPRVQARTTKFGQKVQNNLVKVPIVFGGGGDWPWPSRSNLTWKAKFTTFWACPCHNSPSIQARTTKFGQKMQTNLLVAHIVFGGDWLRPSWSNLTR